MINIYEDIENFDKHIKLMDDSTSYVSNLLDTFYNTEQERSDIRRNVDYLKIMLNKHFISSKISEVKADQIISVIDKAESALKLASHD
jgi:hypothetical protein